ncbi:MAG: hypothetical protein ACR2QM_11395, partial [Longimicrobiales bacterium]
MNDHRVRRSILGLIALVALQPSLGSPVAAQLGSSDGGQEAGANPQASMRDDASRLLGGHRFLPSARLGGSFLD